MGGTQKTVLVVEDNAWNMKLNLPHETKPPIAMK